MTGRQGIQLLLTIVLLGNSSIAQEPPDDVRRARPLQQALAAAHKDALEGDLPLALVILPDVAAEGLLHAFMDVLYASQQLLLRQLRLQVAADDPRIVEGLEIYRSHVDRNAADAPVWPRNPDGLALEELWFVFSRAGIKPNPAGQDAVERIRRLWGDHSWGPFAPFRILVDGGFDTEWVASDPEASGSYAALMRYVNQSVGKRGVAGLARMTRDWPSHRSNEFLGRGRWPKQAREISELHTLCVGGAKAEWKLLAAAGEDLKRFGRDLTRQCRSDLGVNDRMAVDVQLVTNRIERIARACVVAEANCGSDVAAVRERSRSASGDGDLSDYDTMLSLCGAAAGLSERVNWRPILEGERVAVEVAGKRWMGYSWIR